MKELAEFIFRLGRETEARFNQTKELVNQAYDMGYQAGRADVEKEVGLDGLAVLKPKPKASGGTGGLGAAGAAN